jgi:hypothetical protein
MKTKRRQIKLTKAKKSSYRAILAVSILVVMVAAISVLQKQSKKEDILVATVAGDSIYASRVDAIFNSLPEKTYSKVRIVAKLVDTKILVDYLEKNGYNLTEEEFNVMLDKKLQREGITLSELQKELKLRAATLEDVRDSFVIERFADDIEINSTVENTEVTLYRKLNKIQELTDEEIKKLILEGRQQQIFEDIISKHTKDIGYWVNETYMELQRNATKGI